MPHIRLEEVALNAWPALQQVLYDGWLLRFAHGYTKRANSVQPFYGSSLRLEEKITACEAFYAAKGLPCIFRLTPFSLPPELDTVLEGRGYAVVEPSRVMHRELKRGDGSRASGDGLREEPLDAWTELYGRFRGVALPATGVAAAMLGAIWPERRLVSLTHEGEVVACGLAVLEREHVGLFDLVTARAHRNRGHGARLVTSLLAWGRQRGAATAYLQVVGSNHAACHLYEKLGFREAYEYWYRVQAQESEVRRLTG
jgi:N-acetylglutamate synthase